MNHRKTFFRSDFLTHVIGTINKGVVTFTLARVRYATLAGTVTH
jgi:hypothetical protein